MSSPPGKRRKGSGTSRYLLVVLAAVVPLVLSSAAFAGNNPPEPKKAAVCKYVGKPGVDERLQTGQNPIVVDRKSWMHVGSYFQDGQNRSYVLAFLNPGDPDPDISQCPAPAGPTQVTPVAPTTTQPSCNDPTETVTPPSQPGVIWNPTGATTLNPGQSVTYTATSDMGYVFPKGAQTSFTVKNTFDPKTCPQPPTVVNVPAQPSVNDPCGPNNASWNVPVNTSTFHWMVGRDGHLTVTIVANNTTFSGGATSHDYGVALDPGTVCPPPPTDICPDVPGVQLTGLCEPPVVHHPTPHITHHTCQSGDTWFDANHNGRVDKGECVPSAPAETGLGPIAPASTSERSQSGMGIWLPIGLAALMVVGLGSLMGARKLSLVHRR